MLINEEIIKRAAKIKLLLMDCDGVLTDGRLYFTETGETMKVFHVRDGQGLALWHKAGFQSGIITGRGAEKILEKRTTELGIKYLKTLSQDKTKEFEDILLETKLEPEQVAYIGDDVGDICLLEKVGFPAAVSDAVEMLDDCIIYKTQLNGGLGAVREVIDLLLKAKNKSGK